MTALGDLLFVVVGLCAAFGFIGWVTRGSIDGGTCDNPLMWEDDCDE